MWLLNIGAVALMAAMLTSQLRGSGSSDLNEPWAIGVTVFLLISNLVMAFQAVHGRGKCPR